MTQTLNNRIIKAPFGAVRWVGLGALLGAFLLYFSIYIRPLDEVKKGLSKFDAKAYATDFVAKIAVDKAVGLQDLVKAITANKDKAFADYSHAVSIGNMRNFLVKGTGKITKINEDDMQLVSDGLTFTLATEFIYGSAVRDASGQFDIKNFANSADIQALTNEINQIIRKQVVPDFKKMAKVGDTVSFVGAIEMNQAHANTDKLEILPIRMRNDK